MKKVLIHLIIVILVLFSTLTGCTQDVSNIEETGELVFVANGEDFTRKGFVTKDGWKINFDHIYVTLADITAYQTNPPYDAHSGEEIKGQNKVVLNGIKTVDLAKGDENADPIFVGKLDSVPVGHYNAISWKIVKGTEGEAKDNVFVFIGTAEKNGKKIKFNIKLNKEYRFLAGEYIGDERKGIVEKGKSADLEMTFHFDHLFGDIEVAGTDSLNQEALGFQPFAELAENGIVDADMTKLKSKFTTEEFSKLINILSGIGHVGEGECYGEEI
jgi:hypothetical protein